jgi:hypothetical protein
LLAKRDCQLVGMRREILMTVAHRWPKAGLFLAKRLALKLKHERHDQDLR